MQAMNVASRGSLFLVASPIHNGDLLVGQAVALADDLVDQSIGAAEALDQLPVERGVVIIDLVQPAKAFDRPGQGCGLSVSTIV